MSNALTMPAATSTAWSSSRTQLTTEMTVGYHPDQVTGWLLEKIIEQAWEMAIGQTIGACHPENRKEIMRQLRQNRPSVENNIEAMAQHHLGCEPTAGEA